MSGEASAVRSIFAVAAGFFAAAILSLCGDVALRAAAPRAFDAAGQGNASWVLLLMLAYSALFTFAGAYLAARIAIRKPVVHALAAGGVVLLVSVASTVVAWSTAPAWFHITALVLIMPAAFLAGTLRERQPH